MTVEIRALVFDVFGTVVDWRGSIISEGVAFGKAKGLRVDWAAFADAWRAEYRPSMQRVMSGAEPWANLDTLHRRSLEGLLAAFGLDGLSGEEIEQLNRVWHRLLPWPDVVEGLNRLRRRFTLATLSNGNVALLVNMAKRAGLPWDCVLSAELVQAYKPDARVYQSAATFLGLPLDQILMVAAHPEDLRAAKAQGMRTAYVARPLEHGVGKATAAPEEGEFDFALNDFLELADCLGA